MYSWKLKVMDATTLTSYYLYSNHTVSSSDLGSICASVFQKSHTNRFRECNLRVLKYSRVLFNPKLNEKKKMITY